MIRAPWDAVIVSQCDEACPWRTVCSNWIQEGVAMLWRSGKLTRPEDCMFYAHRAQVHRETCGREPPASAAELSEQLAERKAIQAEAGPA